MNQYGITKDTYNVHMNQEEYQQGQGKHKSNIHLYNDKMKIYWI